MAEQNPYADLYQSEMSKAKKPAGAASATPESPSILGRVGNVLGDAYTGAAKGAEHTLGGLGNLLTRPFVSPEFAKSQGSYLENTTTPKNTAEKVGQGIEQAGEFMVPGGAEESLAMKAPAALRTAARIGAGALSSGAINKAQGGSFTGGAAMGVAPGVIGQGLKAVAPTLAEAGLGIGKADRAFSKTPGAAILNETRGIRPETIERTGQDALNRLTPELERATDAANASASLAPARGVLSSAIGKAGRQEAGSLHGQLTDMQDFLHRGQVTGQPIPAQVTPRRLLDLKRGFTEENLGRWNPETHGRTIQAGRETYGAMDRELDRTVPEAAGINQRISSLIPVVRRAESVSRNPSVMQSTLGRFGAHTGALTLGGLGAAQGAHAGGLPGAIVGGLTGLVGPELIASPEGRLAAARLFNRPEFLKPVSGAILAGNREAKR